MRDSRGRFIKDTTDDLAPIREDIRKLKSVEQTQSSLNEAFRTIQDDQRAEIKRIASMCSTDHNQNEKRHAELAGDISSIENDVIDSHLEAKRMQSRLSKLETEMVVNIRKVEQKTGGLTAALVVLCIVLGCVVFQMLLGE